MAPAAPGVLLGQVNAVDRGRVRGWAQDAASPVVLRILDNGVVIGRVVADRYRADLQHAGIGDGRHGFELAVPGGLSPLVRHVIEVQRASDGRGLWHSPWVFEATAAKPSGQPMRQTKRQPAARSRVA